MKEIAADNYSVFGKNNSHKQYAFTNVTKKGKEIKILSYKSEYENEDELIYEKFYIDIKNKKLTSYIYSVDKNFIDNYETYSKKGSELTFKYYDNLIDDNFAVLDEVLDKEIILDKGLKDKYIEVVNDRRTSYGKIVKYEQININTFFSEGQVTIIQRFECVTDREEYVYEELRLIERDGEFKISDYYYAPDYDILIED